MKKNVIVFYYPALLGATEAIQKEQKRTIKEDSEQMQSTILFDNFDVVHIQDPAREKVEVEVFFNPY
jgi:hypothetical protein